LTKDYDRGVEFRREVSTDLRFVVLALSLISVFFAFEIAAAILGHSLVLFADAGHMLTDVAALALSAWALRLAAKPPGGRWTFGLKRAEILAASVNGISLVAMALLIGVGATERLIRPQHVTGSLVVLVAGVGVIVDAAATLVLGKSNRESLNLRAALAHLLTDLYAFAATATSGLVVIFAHWERADSVAALLVAALMLWTAWRLLREAGRILLQAAPDDLDLLEVRRHLLLVRHVIDVHDLHAWTLTSGFVTLSAHVTVEDLCFESGHAPRVLDMLQACLHRDFGIPHATIQLELPSHVSHEDDIHP